MILMHWVLEKRQALEEQIGVKWKWRATRMRLDCRGELDVIVMEGVRR